MERFLHGVNVGGCCLQMVTGAVEIASTGGALSAVGAGLSALAMRKAPDQQREIALRMVGALEAHLETAQIPQELQKQIVLILDSFAVTPQDIARGDIVAVKIAQHMRGRVAAEAIMAEHREDAVLDAYEAMLAATLLPLCQPQTQAEANDREVLGRLAGLEQLIKSQNADQPLRDAGISAEVILGLARKASGSTDNLEQAWIDLTAFFEAALQVQEQTPATNHADFVDDVIAMTRDLAAKGEYSPALDAIADALARDATEQAAQQEAFQARTARLMQRQRNLLVLSDPKEAATFLVAQADRTAGGTADFEALRLLQDEFDERGRDKGTAADLLIAIEVSNATLPRAIATEARGAVLNDLAMALQTLGERESGTARLDEAVLAYREALKEYTRKRVPLEWATTQNNLGNALRTLGSRESGTARLDEAVTAYREALKENTRERVPLDWAMTQNNLGNALQTLGWRESGTARLDEAVTAYRAALKERTRERVPLEWAKTQNNLGNALQTLGSRESGTARLDEAVTAYREALKEWTRERVPLEWATTQNNLGGALQALGERESGTARLDEAVLAYREALNERTRERVPLNWATTQFNLAGIYIAYFEKDGAAAYLDVAERHASYAREVFDEAGATHYLEMADTQLERIHSLRD
ncbi:tetratricopeptide repeat protein [uncultured Sulfitobacter sp.]|uniref:tetratricopeptide repeat protein n=1 Tax=uncultured Sulfitobacter sp. TaxID=191468 RepID=UPI00262824EF|nr:tetratricopeptide repeat protein [uncultured Sulfitobacter sp.]